VYNKKNHTKMEMFDAHRRDILDFDNYMDLKKPGFGGPTSAVPFRDGSGKKVNKNPKLAGYQRVVERDPLFANQVYNPTYKAMTHDLVYKQEKKKPYDYQDPYITALPVTVIPVKEGLSCKSFEQFINEESYGYGANPFAAAEGKRFKLRGKQDADAQSMAEDILDDARIDWDEFEPAEGFRGMLFKKDGDVIAYFDAETRELMIFADADVLSQEMKSPMELPMHSEPEIEDDEEMEDEYYRPDEEDTDTELEREPAPARREDIKDIEKMLKSLENSDDEDADDDEMIIYPKSTEYKEEKKEDEEEDEDFLY